MTAVQSSISLGELASALSLELDGDKDYPIYQAASLVSGKPNQLGFYADKKLRASLSQSSIGAVILKASDVSLFSGQKLIAANPHVAFALALPYLYPDKVLPMTIHPTANIDTSAKVASSVHIGAGVVIGANCVIGTGCIIYPNVTLYPDVKLGNRVVIHSGSVIGSDGFGYANEQGNWRKVLQVGGVQIHDDVEIGANTSIDRGALDDTIIETGVKLDNQIQIGHNCVIGAHTAIAGCVGIAGSTTIGRHCMIGGAAMIAGHLTIGNGVIVSGGTLIASDISEPGQYTGVFPSLPHRSWAKLAGQLRHQIKS